MHYTQPLPFPRQGTWAVVAPSAPLANFPRERLDLGVRRLRDRGARVVFAPNMEASAEHMAGTIAQRVQDLHWAFGEPGIDGVLALWGGWNSNQLLPHLDWEAIAASRRPFCGYSDITALHGGLLARAGLGCYYGPAFGSFCHADMESYTLESWEAAVREREAYRCTAAATSADYHQPAQPNSGWAVLQSGRAQGIAVGGEITTFALLCGTPYLPDTAGAVLVLESDEDGTPPIYDRCLHQLEQAGVLRSIAGLALGRSPRASGVSTAVLGRILDRVHLPSGIPVVAEMDFGHITPLLTIALGSLCMLNTTAPELAFAQR